MWIIGAKISDRMPPTAIVSHAIDSVKSDAEGTDDVAIMRLSMSAAWALPAVPVERSMAMLSRTRVMM